VWSASELKVIVTFLSYLLLSLYLSQLLNSSSQVLFRLALVVVVDLNTVKLIDNRFSPVAGIYVKNGLCFS